MQADGKIVVGGEAEEADIDFGLAGFKANGALDDGFGTGGKTTTSFGGSEDEAEDLVLQADGKIVLGGTTEADFALARYLGGG